MYSDINIHLHIILLWNTIFGMQINMGDIFKFYETRINCHVKAVNYFASLIGHSFPDHDADKVEEPMRTGYAYIFYNNYHPQLKLTEQYFQLCADARATHHKHATHHIPYYNDVSEIPDIRIYEMVSDWASANFEQRNILKDTKNPSLEDWFDINLAHLPWTEHQIELIKQSFETIKKNTDDKIVIDIWQDLVKLV